MLDIFRIFLVNPINSLWTDTGVSGFADPKVYVVQTNIKAVHRCLLMSTDPGHWVDPTCGSGTSVNVAEQWGRRWITIDTSRVALALTRTRLMSARYPYYHLADTTEGIEKEADISGHVPSMSAPKTEGDIKKGFVYRRVPHITLKSIANNPYIREGMSREEKKRMPPLLAMRKLKYFTISPMRTRNAFALRDHSQSRACPRIAC